MKRVQNGVLSVVCGLALLAAGSVSMAGDIAAEELLRQAYLAVVDAELASGRSHRVDAIQAYHRAIDLYTRIQAEYPGWQADAVDYRVADCRNQIAALESVSNPDSDGSAAQPAATTNAEARLARLVEELKMARAALGNEPDVAGSRREWDRLRDERDEALRSVQSLQRKITRLEQAAHRGDAAAKNVSPTNLPSPLVIATIKAEARRLMQADSGDQALLLIREAEPLAPQDLDMAVLHGLAACQAGRFDDAVQVLLPYDTPELKQATVLVTLGSAFMGMARLGEARVAMEKALKLDPQSAEAHYNLAQILLALRPPDADGAEAHYSQAIALGARQDPAFENSLRTAIIVARMKSRPRSTGTSVKREIAPATLPGAATKK